MKLPKTYAPKEITKNVRFRLLVSLPVIITAFSLASAFLTMNLIRSAIHIPFPASSLLLIAGGILAIALIACLTGIMLAYGITKPLRRLTITAESLISEK